LCDFLGYDDPGYYAENTHVLGGFTWQNIIWAFTNGEVANWHPLTWFSHMLDAEIFGKSAAGPHLVNILFHAANVVLLFFVLCRLTVARWQSVVVALIFAVHPLHVESVAWISERKDLLCAFFTLLSLLFYGRYAELAKNQIPGAGRFYAACLVCFALGLMSKPMIVTLPFVLLLLDWWPLNRITNFPMGQGSFSSLKPLLIEKVPFLLLSMAVSVVTYFVQDKGFSVQTFATFPLSIRLENTFVSYARYLGKVLWPVTLAIPYPYPDRWPVALVILSVLLVAGASVAAFWLVRKWPPAFTGWFWFVGMLIPVIGLVQVGTQSMADRYAYLPMVGLLIIVVWGLAKFAVHCNLSTVQAAAAVLLILAAYSMRTREQLAYWHNDGTLFGHSLNVTTNNYVAQINYGAWLSKTGHPKEALEHYNVALRLKPDDPTALYDTGNILARLGQLDEAIANYRRALQITPDKPDILNNLGVALMKQKQLPEAIAAFQSALKIKPDFADVHNNLATAFFRQGRYEDAAREFYQAVNLAPDSVLFSMNLGDAMLKLGEPKKAEECYQRALQMEPDNPSIIAKINSLHSPDASAAH
jgi:Flp pilus assembly protein TadD